MEGPVYYWLGEDTLSQGRPLCEQYLLRLHTPDSTFLRATGPKEEPFPVLWYWEKKGEEKTPAPKRAQVVSLTQRQR